MTLLCMLLAHTERNIPYFFKLNEDVYYDRIWLSHILKYRPWFLIIMKAILRRWYKIVGIYPEYGQYWSVSFLLESSLPTYVCWWLIRKFCIETEFHSAGGPIMKLSVLGQQWASTGAFRFLLNFHSNNMTRLKLFLFLLNVHLVTTPNP